MPKARPPGRRGRPRKRPEPKIRRAPRTSQAADAIEAITVAAEQLLLRHGVPGLTTNRIAEVAGVSIGTLYHYFPNREAIVAALYARYLSAYATLLPIVTSDASVEEVVSGLVMGALEIFEKQPAIHQHLHELRAASGSRTLLDEQHAQFLMAITAGLVARGLAEPDKAKVIAFVVFNAFEGIVLGISPRPPDVPPRDVARVVGAMLGGYLARLPD